MSIARINLEKTEPAPLYNSFDDATQGLTRCATSIPERCATCPFVNVAYYNNKPYIQQRSGEWMRASPVHIIRISRGWNSHHPAQFVWLITDTAEVRTAPTYAGRW